jgi:phospholipid transport system transporter-binding protein
MIVRQGNRHSIEGSVTLDNVENLLSESKGIEGDDVIVDFSRVTAIDSSALSLILELTRRFNGNGGRQITFVNLTQSLRSLAELYGVLELIPVSAD